ncbi:MAG: universal stress protein [Rudaea sp.]
MLDILVHANNHESSTCSMRYAAHVANLLDGSLTGIFVAPELAPVSSVGMPIPFPEFRAFAAELIEQARNAEGRFCQWAGECGVAKSRWQVADGPLISVLASAANWHDLLVLESGNSSPWSSVGVLGRILLTCGLPCMVVPESYGKQEPIENVLIASNGSAETIRTVHAAIPLLRRAKRISLICGSRIESYSAIDWQPPVSVEGLLAWHGLSASERMIDAAAEDVGGEILTAAWESDANLIVMGAYGRSRFSEWFLGGATRYVLEHAKLPLFMRN